MYTDLVESDTTMLSGHYGTNANRVKWKSEKLPQKQMTLKKIYKKEAINRSLFLLLRSFLSCTRYTWASWSSLWRESLHIICYRFDLNTNEVCFHNQPLTTRGPSIPALDTVAPNHWCDFVSICSPLSLKVLPVWAEKRDKCYSINQHHGGTYMYWNYLIL